MRLVGLQHTDRASLNGHTECVRILTETDKVEWNKRGERGCTALFNALNSGHSDTVEIIVQQPNIDYNAKTDWDETLGHAAVLGGDGKCVETLAAQEKFDCWNVPDSERNIPILMALQDGKTKIVQILANCPRINLNLVDWNFPDKLGKTPLYLALEKVEPDSVSFIVQQQIIDYNVKSKHGITLAEVAVEGDLSVKCEENKKCVEILAAQEGCDCWNVPDWDGDTPIMRAQKWNRTDIVEILLRCPRVDVNCRDKEGWSLLFIAIQKKNNLGEKI